MELSLGPTDAALLALAEGLAIELQREIVMLIPLKGALGRHRQNRGCSVLQLRDP